MSVTHYKTCECFIEISMSWSLIIAGVTAGLSSQPYKPAAAVEKVQQSQLILESEKITAPQLVKTTTTAKATMLAEAAVKNNRTLYLSFF